MIVYVLVDALVEIPDIVNLVGSVWKQVVVQINKIIIGHACHEINDNFIRILTQVVLHVFINIKIMTILVGTPDIIDMMFVKDG
jgi:hypothetical protein